MSFGFCFDKQTVDEKSKVPLAIEYKNSPDVKEVVSPAPPASVPEPVPEPEPEPQLVKPAATIVETPDLLVRL